MTRQLEIKIFEALTVKIIFETLSDYDIMFTRTNPEMFEKLTIFNRQSI
jgi:hypothetical protein